MRNKLHGNKVYTTQVQYPVSRQRRELRPAEHTAPKVGAGARIRTSASPRARRGECRPSGL